MEIWGKLDLINDKLDKIEDIGTTMIEILNNMKKITEKMEVRDREPAGEGRTIIREAEEVGETEEGELKNDEVTGGVKMATKRKRETNDIRGYLLRGRKSIGSPEISIQQRGKITSKGQRGNEINSRPGVKAAAQMEKKNKEKDWGGKETERGGVGDGGNDHQKRRRRDEG